MKTKENSCVDNSLFKVKMNRKILKNCVFIWLMTMLILIYCSGGAKKQKAVTAINSVPEYDSTFLFNGRDLDGWEITNFGPQGPVYVSGGSIVLGMGEGCTGITWKKDFPEKDYRVTLVQDVWGMIFCGMTFPVGKEPCTLIVGGWGTTVGLSSINSMDASENQTTSFMEFEERWYK